MKHPAPGVALPLVLALLAGPAWSQAFDPPVLLQDSIASPMRPEPADLDGDGDEDLVVASSADGVLGWIERTGPGTLAPWTRLSSGLQGFDRLAVEDLDGDGDPDVALASYWDDELAWLENAGGELRSKVTISTATRRPISLCCLDVDADGAPDLVAGSATDKRLEWYRNLGGGSFAAPAVLEDPLGHVGNPAAADLDGDGVVDVLVTNSSQGIGWFRGLGAGSFATYTALATDMSLPVRVATLDVDGVGQPDVLCLSVWDSTLAWYPNTAGVLGARQVINAATAQAQELFLRDLDGDGDTDLLLEDGGGVGLGWHPNLGAGVFGPHQVALLAGTASVDVGTSDLDGDGDLDLVNASGLPWSAGVAWYENLGGGVWGPGTSLMDCLLGELSLGVGDLDGDLDMDLVAGGGGDGKLVWFANLGGGAFGPMQQVDVLQTDSLDDLVVDDLDGDGDADLLIASRTRDLVAWYPNLGTGAFGAQAKLAWGFMEVDDPYSVATTDLDGDGILDVLSASVWDQKLAWYRGQGSGAFATGIKLNPWTELAGRIASGDLDGDGDLDLALAEYQDQVVWHPNLGGGTLGGQVSLSTASVDLEQVLPVDLDGDGDLDLVAVSSGDDTLARFENLGGGTFGPRVVVDAGIGGASSVTAVDPDGDGDLDLVVTAGDDGQVLWTENLGAGVLAGALVIDAGSTEPSGTVAADFDGDGDLDLVSARRHQLAFHEQVPAVDCDGDGVHDPTAVLSGLAVDCDGNLVPDACDLLLPGADIDGDGQLDACVPPPLVADAYQLSVAAGGTRTLTLTGPAPGAIYLLLGTLSGTTPGTAYGGQLVPLNADAYLLRTLTHPNQPPLAASLGVLAPLPGGPGGTATATFTLPPAFDPVLVGLTAHHAFVTLGATPAGLGLVSNPVPLALLP